MSVSRIGSPANYYDEAYISNIYTSSLITATTQITLADAQTGAATGISFDKNLYRSCNINYSIERGTNFETGIIRMTHDGTSAYLAQGEIAESSENGCGIDFSVDVSSNNVRLLFDSTSTGFAAKMNYTITYHPLSSSMITLLDNQAGAVATGLIFDKTIQRAAKITYSLTRGTNVETGVINLTHDGTNSFMAQGGIAESSEYGCGIDFSTDIDGDNIRLLYTSTSTGATAGMNYNITYFPLAT